MNNILKRLFNWFRTDTPTQSDTVVKLKHLGKGWDIVKAIEKSKETGEGEHNGVKVTKISYKKHDQSI